jgi:hypothetical protein
MNRRFLTGLAFVLVLLVAVTGVGLVAFNMGLAQGAAQSALLTDGGAAVRSVPYMFYPRPWGFGLGFGGVLVFLLFLFLVFGLARRLMWGGMYHGWRMRGGPWRWGDDPARGTRVPPFFDEWHRQAHAQQPGEQPDKQ